MQKNDHNRTPEQKKPSDVAETPSEAIAEDEQSIAPSFVNPAGTKENSDRPVVNPVTGGAL